MKFTVFQISRKGGRQKNEDRMGYCHTRESGLFVLADGMGGHPQGEVAAQLALEAVSALYHREAQPRVPDAHAFLGSALMAAHHRIVRYAGERAMLDTPRTTAVACLVQGGTATWAHCGDSRLYLVRDGAVIARTRDHSYLEQPGAGPAPPRRINRNVLFTCLGSPSRPVFDLHGPVALHRGDRLLLCSDGLWGNVADTDIAAAMTRQPVPDAVPELIERALAAGGPRCDNVTAIGIEWEMPEAIEVGGAQATASNGPAALSGNVADELDDAAIERSIAEINAAIQRSAAERRRG